MGSTARQAIDGAESRLESAFFGLQDMLERPERFRSGFMNAVIFGRQVTFSLQNMRGTTPGFDEWYDCKRSEMASDPLIRYFTQLRNKIEKEASSQLTSVSSEINISGSDWNLIGPKPPGATAFFIGSARHGGASGWEIPRANGEVDYYFIELPERLYKYYLHLFEPPDGYENYDARSAVKYYLEKLKRIVDEAREEFL